MLQQSFFADRRSSCLRVVSFAAAAVLAFHPAGAQQIASTDAPLESRTAGVPRNSAVPASAVLPDSPGAIALGGSSSSSSPEAAGQGNQPSLNAKQPAARPFVPSPTDQTVAPGQVGPHQTPRDKLIGSAKSTVTPFSFAGKIISAGYSHGVNSSPNYGTDSAAFGQRVGASFARGTSQDLFLGVTASLLREDPRYYQLGSHQNLLKRAVYAATRPVIGRSDGGKAIPNFALLSAYLGAALLTQTYYPQPNQGTSELLKTWGGSVGGAAIGFEVTEFLPDALQIVHLKRASHP